MMAARTRLASLVVAVLLGATLGPAGTAQDLGAAAGPGGGGGHGGGGHGGGSQSGSLYSDLVIALRDVDGLPIMTEFDVLDLETDPPSITTEHCVQPVSPDPLPGIDPATAVVNPVDGRTVYPIPLIGQGLDEPIAAAEDDEEVEVCDPQPAYNMYVTEAELERLNMVRTDDDVIARKISDVLERMLVTQEITLDGAGRLVFDGLVIDAGPEHAAIFQEIMFSGALGSLDPAAVAPFGPWELAAASVGAAASKFTPLSIDAVVYYMRIADVAASDGWRPGPLVHPTSLEGGEEFVNFRDFSYNRAEVFPGGVTWLDVPALTWKTSRILDEIPFAELPPIAEEDGTLANVAGFAQLVEDVRAVIYYLHENETVEGFFMDPVGQDTYDQQLAALSAPATSWDQVPGAVVQTETFPVTASVFNPWGGALIDEGLLRITLEMVEEGASFTADDAARITAVEQVSEQSVPFAYEAGTLVGTWGLPGFPIAKGYNESTTFDMKVVAGAPVGTYRMTLDLVPVGESDPLATDVATLSVLPPELTAMWTSPSAYISQGAYPTVTARVFNPEGAGLATGEQLQLLLSAGDPFTATNQVTAWSDAVAVPFDLVAEDLVGSLTLADLPEGQSVSVTWSLLIAADAPLGWYEATVSIPGSPAAPDVLDLYVAPAEAHGPDDPGGGGGGGEEPAVPAVPTGVTAVAGDRSATVSWVPGVGDTAATSYVIYALDTSIIRTVAAPATSLEVTGLTNGTSYSFVVYAIADGSPSLRSAPSNAVTPTAPKPPPAPDEPVAIPASSFSDVPRTSWYAAPVDWAVYFGITTGIGGTNLFLPTGTATRAQVVTFLWRMVDRPIGYPASGFVDVAESAYYADAVRWAKATGVTTGVGGTSIFAPDQPVTRAEAVVFLHRASGLKAGAPASGFSDVPRGTWYTAAVDWAKYHGITTGVGGTNQFLPGDDVTRAQTVTFMYRLASTKAAWSGKVPSTVLF